MSDGPYLFDVGVIALAHAGTPVSETALSYVKDAIEGAIDAVVPYPALFGAHIVLTSYYGFSNADAARLMQNFTDASRIHWYDEIAKSTVRDGFAVAATHNVDGWDGYYARVAVEEGVETILTLDDDFENVDGVTADVILSPEEFATLTAYIDS
jgi:predicted nucleic acid-binding protein